MYYDVILQAINIINQLCTYEYVAFITHSNWDHRILINQFPGGKQVLPKELTGLIIDESVGLKGQP